MARSSPWVSPGPPTFPPSGRFSRSTPALRQVSYINNHFADWETGAPLSGYDNLSVYFNTDWYGRFRGIFLEGNPLVVPIFTEWMKPFADLGLTHLIPVNTRGTDIDSFNTVGLPGFKFLQDDLGQSVGYDATLPSAQ